MSNYEALKPVRSKATKTFVSIFIVIGTIPIIAISVVLFALISFFTPDKDRHTTIDWAKERVGIHESGKVLSERYDSGDKFLPTSLWVTLDGEDPYEKLFQKVQSIPGIKCQEASPRPTIATKAKQCRTGSLEIQVRIEKRNDGTVTVVTFIDSSSGKQIPDPNADGNYESRNKCKGLQITNPMYLFCKP